MRMTARPLALLAAMAACLVQTGPAIGQDAAPAAIGAASLVPVGTPVRLMVLREVNSRTAKSGERFKLRVDEPVFINGAPVIPVGATAWGEIVSVQKNGAVGKGGKLGAKLLYVDLPAGRLPLRGEPSDRGDGNDAGVALAIVGFGLFGLLTGGDSARLKAGDSFTGYVDGALVTPEAAVVSATGEAGAPAETVSPPTTAQ